VDTYIVVDRSNHWKDNIVVEYKPREFGGRRSEVPVVEKVGHQAEKKHKREVTTKPKRKMLTLKTAAFG
jgi:hypothetical protein